MSYKHYEGKVKHGLPGESREDEVKRVNHHVAMSSAIASARDRHERRHKGKKGTALAERKEHIKRMSAE